VTLNTCGVYKFRDFLLNLPRSGHNQRCHKPFLCLPPWILCLWRLPLPRSGLNNGCHKSFLPVKNISVKNYPLWNLSLRRPHLPRIGRSCGRQHGCHKCFSAVKNYPILNFMLPAAAATTCVPYASSPVKNSPSSENLLLLLCCALQTRDLFMIAKFLALSVPLL